MYAYTGLFKSAIFAESATKEIEDDFSPDMANAAAKKAAKAANAVSGKTSAVIGGSIGFFLIYRCFWNYNSIRWFHMLGFIFQVFCLLVAYYGMIENARNSSSTEVYFDLYCVTVASQLVSAVSDWGWYILILIPLYGGYLGYGLWKSNPLGGIMGGAPEQEDSYPSDKKKDKKKVKYVRGR